MRAAVLVVLVAVASPAFAQNADEKARAKAAFERAVTAEHDKDWHRAIDEFQQAYDILPRADVLYNIGVDLERLEEYRDAATFYRRYLDDKKDAEDRDKVERLIENLRGRTGVVSVTGDPPGAHVRVDGDDQGATPVDLELSGAHHIDVVDGEATWARDITVEFGEPQTLAATLVAKTGTLTVHSNVDGAQVTIDGESAGVTPLDVSVTAGTHQIVVVAPTWSSYQRAVDVPAEGQAQVTANLVHPLGYVEPPTTAPSDKAYYFAASGGRDASGVSGAVGALMFGEHSGRWDAALGYGYLGGRAGFQCELRLHLTRGHLRPYLRVAADLGGATGGFAAAGLLFNIPTRSKTTITLFGDAAFGWARVVDQNSGLAATGAVAPITGGVQIAY